MAENFFRKKKRVRQEARLLGVPFPEGRNYSRINGNQLLQLENDVLNVFVNFSSKFSSLAKSIEVNSAEAIGVDGIKIELKKCCLYEIHRIPSRDSLSSPFKDK